MVLKHLGQKKYLLMLAVCVVLDIIVMMFWGTQKNNFYWDEYHTYKNAHDVTGAGSASEYIDDVFESDKWNSVSDMKSIYGISDDVSIRNVKDFVLLSFDTDPFSPIFSVWQSWFFPQHMNKWAGISLNIVFNVLTILIMYLLMCKLTNPRLALAACVMYMYCGFTVSMTLFVRSYLYSIFLIILELYMLFVIVSCNNIVKAILAMLVNWVCVLLAYLCNPFAGVVSIGFVVTATCVFVFSEKKKFPLGAYCGLTILGGIAFLIKSGYLNLLLHMKSSVESGELGNAKRAIFSNFLDTTPRIVWDRLIQFLDKYITLVFEKKIIFVMCLLVMIVMFITRMIKIKTPNETFSAGTTFTRIVLGGLILFFVFSIAFGTTPLIRYYSWIFPISIIAFFLWAHYFTEAKNVKICSVVMFSCIIVCSVSTFFNDKVENLYKEDKGVYEYVSDSKSRNIVLDFDGCFLIQNCVYYATDDSELYYSRKGIPQLDNSEGEYLLWINELAAHPDIIEQIEAQNCEFSFVGRTYLAEIYSVKEKE